MFYNRFLDFDDNKGWNQKWHPNEKFLSVQGSKERSNKSDDVIRCTTRSDTNSQVSEASEVESRSRKSDSGQNYKVSEASEHEVKSRSSDSEQMPSGNSEIYQRYLNSQEITSEARSQDSSDTRRL